MSETSWDWAALIVVVVLFAGLALLSKKTKVNFSWRVIIATVLGIIVGVGFSGHTAYVGAFGAIWSKVISAIVVPLLLFSIVASIGRIGGAGRLKNISLKTIVLLLVNTFTAAVIALVLGLLFQVGKGFDQALPKGVKPREVPGVVDTLVGLFPSNLADNWANNQVIPIVIFAILLAVSMNKAASTPRGEKSVAPLQGLRRGRQCGALQGHPDHRRLYPLRCSLPDCGRHREQ